VRRAVVACLGAAVLTGCGASSHTKGTASLWITRDRGAHVVLVRKVPAGQTAMQALQKVAAVKTRYGGRFVHSIDGVSGSLSAQRDWFYFINGYEADRGAAEYELHDGDVEWWDYRGWKNAINVPVVVGAFPEPFLHGYDGERRKTALVYDSRDLAPEAKALGEVIDAKKLSADELKDADVLVLTRADVPFTASTKGAGEPVQFTIGVRDARRLIRNVELARFRYSGLP
jgi:hypothetical protein